MLARVSGGNSGIAEYLESGMKNGRDFTRDELDNRQVIEGDLSLTNDIINSIEDKGQDRYLHITLSFREDTVSNETLKAVVEDYKSMLTTAYENDEFNFYAEAHLPKIKTIQDRKSGEMVERKPHIHIVIPKTNLLTGNSFNP
ncbi:relaxase, partial [Salmonella enterica]|nr:relaxase [Salmonella enterica]